MARKVLCLMVLVAILNPAFSQNKKEKLAFSFNSVFKTGWWIYHKGLSNGAVKNDMGWDRTHYQPKISFEAGLTYRFKKIISTLFVSTSFYFEREMLEHEDFVPKRREYAISDGTVSFFEYGLQLSYDLINSGKFSLSPDLGIGLFEIETSHPQRDNFGTRYFWHFGIQNKIRKGNITWILAPQYQEMTIHPKEKVYQDEQHKIHGFGLNLGVRYWIK